jgi:hypothetical protein
MSRMHKIISTSSSRITCHIINVSPLRRTITFTASQMLAVMIKAYLDTSIHPIPLRKEVVYDQVTRAN